LAGQLVGTMLLEGVLQGLIIWSLRYVLLAIGESPGGSPAALVWGSLLIFGIWVARAGNTAVGEVVSARLAHRVEVDAMQRVLAKLLTLSVRFFQQNSRADLLMAFYHDLKGVRAVTLGLGKIVLSTARLVGLGVAVWILSPMLAVIGLIAIPAGAVPV
jgi:ABC-type multidrug transport system fused ATPase/permease subunit